MQANMIEQFLFMSQLAGVFEARHIGHYRCARTKPFFEAVNNGGISTFVQPEIVCVDN
jgi:hypothetical protein